MLLDVMRLNEEYLAESRSRVESDASQAQVNGVLDEDADWLELWLAEVSHFVSLPAHRLKLVSFKPLEDGVYSGDATGESVRVVA